MMVQAQADMGESSTMPFAPQHTPTIIQPSISQPQKKQKPRKSKGKDTQETQPSEPTIKVADEALNKESVPTHSNDPLLSGDDSIQLKELMDFCTKLQQRVINLENIKISQTQEISSLKKRVKRLEKKKRSRTHGLKRLYKVGLSTRVKSSSEESLSEENASKQGRKITDIDADKELTLVGESTDEQGALKALKTSKPKIRGIVIKDHEEPSKSTTTTTPTFIADSTRPMAKGLVLQEPVESTRTTTTVSLQQPSQVKDKGKGKMVEPEMPLKKKAQISLDEELAFKLQAEK
uniref:Uncharacterized protein n=1 Tax=Tanacetum cinerariifolium TaxID=118510 RepID=A0A699H958_TANCI|nr:hypothetical protein [Tanacetum cinerariifolium]